MNSNNAPGRPFRPLLPRAQSSGASNSGTQLPPRKAHTRVACEGCRRKRIKCDGQRPICTSCTTYNTPCTYLSADPNESRSSAIKRKYSEAQDRVSVHEQLYNLLRTRSQPEVTEIVRRIRAGIDVEAILRYVRDGDLLLQLHLMPEARLRYTFPEFASWPTVFRDPEDPYLKTQLLDFGPGPGSAPWVEGRGSQQSSGMTTNPHLHVYQMPYHAAQMVDPRLSSVKASRWTSVTADDALVAKLLSIYFQFEYSRTRLFLKDLFLDDLVKGKTNFCSALLVNCILANAAHGLTTDPHRVEFWTPRSLPYAFLAEAKRLWDIEVALPGEHKLTTIHAAMSLTLRYGADGADKIGVPFMLKALEIAQEMELFTRVEKGDTKMSLARAFTAWSIFSYHGMTCYYMQKAPIQSTPPATPLPDYSSIAKLTGEVYVKYPLQPYLTPILFGLSFRAQVVLNLIMMEITQTACDAGGPGTSPPTLAQAIEFYHRIGHWHSTLPTELDPGRVVMPHHLQIHMEYCLVLINLFEPWMAGPEADHVVNPETKTTVRDIGTRSRARLETLIRLYYLRHSFDALDVMLIMFLLLLGSITARVLVAPPTEAETEVETEPTETKTPDPTSSSSPSDTTSSPLTTPDTTPPPHIRDASTFLLCAKGLHDQGQNQYLGSLMFNMLSGLVDTSSSQSQAHAHPDPHSQPNNPNPNPNPNAPPTSDTSITTQNQHQRKKPPQQPSLHSLATDLARIRAEFRGTEVKPEYVHMEWPVYRWIDPAGRSLERVLEGVEELDTGDGTHHGSGIRTGGEAGGGGFGYGEAGEGYGGLGEGVGRGLPDV